jgi:carbon storage regulator CsrA
MLVLTRKLGQRLIIGDDVVVTVLSTRNGQVRLGIEAPRSVSIRREELDALPAPTGEDPHLVVTGTKSEWM